MLAALEALEAEDTQGDAEGSGNSLTPRVREAGSSLSFQGGVAESVRSGEAADGTPGSRAGSSKDRAAGRN